MADGRWQMADGRLPPAVCHLPSVFQERATGLEPATSSLGRRKSTKKTPVVHAENRALHSEAQHAKRRGYDVFASSRPKQAHSVTEQATRRRSASNSACDSQSKTVRRHG